MNDLEKLQDSLDAIPVNGSPSIKQVCTALALAQGEFKAPVRTKTARVKGRNNSGNEYSYEYKYAPLEEIINSVKDVLAKNGLFYYQDALPPRFNVLRTVIRHSSGEFIESFYPIFPTKDGAAGFGSGITYARRYALSLALGLAPEDDDDNVETPAGGSPRIADQPVPSSRSQHPTPLTESEREGTGAFLSEKEWEHRLITIFNERGIEALRLEWTREVPANMRKGKLLDLVKSLAKGRGDEQ